MARNSAVLWCMVAEAMASCADGRSCVGPGVKRRPLRIISFFPVFRFPSWGNQIYFVEICGTSGKSLRAMPQQHHAGAWVVRVLYNQQSITIGRKLRSSRHPLYLCQSIPGNPRQTLNLRETGIIGDRAFGHHAHTLPAVGIHKKIGGINGGAAAAEIAQNMSRGL